MRTFAALDLETTGLDPDRDTILEIGAVKFKGNRIEGEYSTLVNPGRPISPFVSQLTGITDATVANAHADPRRVAVKLMRWSWELTDEQRGGLTRRQFIRCQLMRLKLGEGLTQITYGTMPRWIASVEERLALKPELRRS